MNAPFRSRRRASRPLPDAAPPDEAARLALAELALSLAQQGGADYADIRLGATLQDYVCARDERLETVWSGESWGFGLRVLRRGSWGFCGATSLTPAAIRRAVETALAMRARSSPSRARQSRSRRCPSPRIVGRWRSASIPSPCPWPRRRICCSPSTPRRATPAPIFAPRSSRRRARSGSSLTAAEAASGRAARASGPSSRSPPSIRRAGASPRATASSRRAAQAGIMSIPRPHRGRAARRRAGAPEGQRQARHARKIRSRHRSEQSVSHHPRDRRPFDRARPRARLGGEFRGDDLCEAAPAEQSALRLRPHDDLRRPAPGGRLATIGYDDDGAPAAFADFNIVETGVFRNFQMAIGQAHSSACRCRTAAPMPTISAPSRCSACRISRSSPMSRLARATSSSRASGTGSMSSAPEAGASISSATISSLAASSSTRSRTASSARWCRAAAYQGRTLDFWSGLDGLGDASTYALWGVFTCGKAEPMQLAPVSHDAPCARFRGVEVLNTDVGLNSDDGKFP